MEQQHYPFKIVPLPYDYNALEPFIDTLTMELHHDRHLQTYVDNLNKALADYPMYHGWTLEQLIRYPNKLPPNIRTAVRNNAGGVYNHNFYFKTMSSQKERTQTENLKQWISNEFGNIENFKKEFKEKALSVFGSGYAWLVSDKYGRLKIITTANQDTPLTLNFVPIMVIDVWEHAYYLKHYNKRADYIDDWFHVSLIGQ